MDDFWILISEKKYWAWEILLVSGTGCFLLSDYVLLDTCQDTFLSSLIIIIGYGFIGYLIVCSREYLNILWRSKEDGNKSLIVFMLFVYLLTEIPDFIMWYTDTIFKGL